MPANRGCRKLCFDCPYLNFLGSSVSLGARYHRTKMELIMEFLKKLYKKMKPADYILYSAIILGGILLDQLTKWLSVKFLAVTDTVPLIKGVLHLTYVENTGAAFGMLKDQRWVFILVSTVTIIAFLAYLYLGHAGSRLYGIAFSMIISGGIGNMIDRLALGYVVDFIDFRLINFAVFNGADSFVCVGAGIMILALILELRSEALAAKKSKAAVADKAKGAVAEKLRDTVAENAKDTEEK